MLCSEANADRQNTKPCGAQAKLKRLLPNKDDRDGCMARLRSSVWRYTVGKFMFQRPTCAGCHQREPRASNVSFVHAPLFQPATGMVAEPNGFDRLVRLRTPRRHVRTCAHTAVDPPLPPLPFAAPCAAPHAQHPMRITPCAAPETRSPSVQAPAPALPRHTQPPTWRRRRVAWAGLAPHLGMPPRPSLAIIVPCRAQFLCDACLKYWRAVEMVTCEHGCLAGPSFAYSLPMHPVHTRRDRVASLPPCCLHGAAIQSASPLGPGRALTLPCGWNNAGLSTSKDVNLADSMADNDTKNDDAAMCVAGVAAPPPMHSREAGRSASAPPSRGACS